MMLASLRAALAEGCERQDEMPWLQDVANNQGWFGSARRQESARRCGRIWAIGGSDALMRRYMDACALFLTHFPLARSRNSLPGHNVELCYSDKRPISTIYPDFRKLYQRLPRAAFWCARGEPGAAALDHHQAETCLRCVPTQRLALAGADVTE